MHRLSRKRTLRRLAAVATGTAAVAGTLVFLPVTATAQAGGAAAAGQPSGLQACFKTAAAQYHVPLSVLLGVAHEESGWTVHQGYSADGGWGLMNLTDVTSAMLTGGDAGTAGRADAGALADQTSAHTLQAAAQLTGISADDLRHDTRSNILGGAALLASYQEQVGESPSTRPADWTAAIARYSRLHDQKAAKAFVNDVFGTIRSGGTGNTAAAENSATAAPVNLPADPAAQPAMSQVDRLRLDDTSSSQADCPATVNCQFVPAAASNEQVSQRPSNGIEINEIVIHTTEETYDKTINIFQTPGGSSVQYVMRAADGAVTQMVPNSDIAFGDGNYWSNLHSVQIEHEGYSAHGADWYTDAAYRQTAALVRYLAAEYHVPLDRQHIVGHDNVPAPSDAGLAGQHWDPGYAWDWSRFMRLLDAPTDRGRHGVGPVGTAVTIAPGYGGNEQTYTVCPGDDPTGATTECTAMTAPSNSLFVRSAPSADAPLLLDPVLHPTGTAGTDRVNDWSDTVQDGQQFVVAGRHGDWTAIWFDGQQGWIDNPGGRNTIPAYGVRILRAADGTAGSGAPGSGAPVYGSAYPDADEYPDGLSPSTQKPLTATNYSIAPGQAYVADQAPAASDDYFPSSGAVVKGAKRYYTVQFNHRYVHVNAADVRVSR